MELKVGDKILFDHFGGKDRRGTVVKITKTAVHVEWTAPSSGKTRVVRLRSIPYGPSRHQVLQPGVTAVSDLVAKNVRLASTLVSEGPSARPAGDLEYPLQRKIVCSICGYSFPERYYDTTHVPCPENDQEAK